MSSERHYVQQGDYWPYRRIYSSGARVNENRVRDESQRYGVLQTEGYCDGRGPKYEVTFYVVDLAREAQVVRSYTCLGRPGDDRVQRNRVLACELADRLNREELAA